MDLKKRIAKRITITFLLIMILVTFSSRTIIYFTTPKVVTIKVQGGQISNDQIIKDISFIYSESSSIKFDKQYSTPIRVSKINCKEGDFVKAGDILITFDSKDLSEMISQTQKDIDNARQELADFRKEFTRYLEDELAAINDKSDEIIDLQKIINDNKTSSEPIQDIEGSEKQLERLKRDLVRMQEDYNAIKNSGQFNGTTEAEQQREINKRQAELDELNHLLNNYTDIKAPEDCTITKIYVQEGQDYDGSTELIDYRVSDIPIKIVAMIGDDMYNEMKDYVTLNPNCKVMYQGSTVDARVEGIEKKTDDNYMYIVMDSYEKLQNVNPRNVNIKIEKKSKNYTALIPNEAIFQDSYVYVVNEQTGFLGKELIVRKIQIKKGEYNSRVTGIEEGLTGYETIVKGTDREITDGQRVMINNKVTD